MISTGIAETTRPPELEADDEHYLVKGRADILSILGIMAAHKVPVRVQFADRPATAEVHLISVKPHYEELLFDAAGVSNLFFVKGRDYLTAEATYDYIHVRFTAGQVEAMTHCRKPAFRARIPGAVTRTQRRGSVRFPVPSLNPPVIRLRQNVRGPEMRMRVMDISFGGVSLVLEDRRADIAAGTLLVGCMLELPLLGAVNTDLAVVYTEEIDHQNGWRRLGCRFSDLSLLSLERVRAYVAVLERDRLNAAADGNK